MSRNKTGCTYIGFGARQISVPITKLMFHLSVSARRNRLRKVLLKKCESSRNGVGTDWNAFDIKLDYLDIILVDSSVV